MSAVRRIRCDISTLRSRKCSDELSDIGLHIGWLGARNDIDDGAPYNGDVAVRCDAIKARTIRDTEAKRYGQA